MSEPPIVRARFLTMAGVELDDLQIRVLGCLVEKEITTPDYYPMTLNSLITACNQSSNRSPVVDYDETTVTRGVTSLQDVGLCRAVHRPGQRTVKYRHALDDVLHTDREEAAVLAVLMLRGPQTLGELRTRTVRYHDFADLDSVHEVLDGLVGRDLPLVERLERRPGEKESRWRHLLGSGEPSPVAVVIPVPAVDTATPPTSEASVVTEDTEARLARLESLMARIAVELGLDLGDGEGR